MSWNARKSVRVVVPGEGGGERLPHKTGVECAAPTSPATGQTALVVLGCRPLWSGDELQGALGRRVRAAFERFSAAPATIVVSGGRTWDGVVEADAMRAQLVRYGVEPSWVVRERCSLSTRDNARLSVELLRRRDVHRATVVTCDWHLARAMNFFGREGLRSLQGLPVPGPSVSTLAGWHRVVHEWVAVRIDRSPGATS